MDDNATYLYAYSQASSPPRSSTTAPCSAGGQNRVFSYPLYFWTRHIRFDKQLVSITSLSICASGRHSPLPVAGWCSSLTAAFLHFRCPTVANLRRGTHPVSLRVPLTDFSLMSFVSQLVSVFLAYKKAPVSSLSPFYCPLCSLLLTVTVNSVHLYNELAFPVSQSEPVPLDTC